MNEIEELLNSGADINISDKNNFTLLMTFVQKGDLEIVKTLLKNGANVNTQDLSSMTALDYAIKSKQLEIAKLLVKNGANISSDNYMLAIESNFKELVSFFDTLDPDKHIFLKDKLKYPYIVKNH